MTLASVVLVMIIRDILDSWWSTRMSGVNWVLLDSLLQTVVALLVVSPLFRHQDLSARTLHWIALAGCITILLDMDHFVAARSLALHDALSLGARPASHSLLFASTCGLLVGLVTRRATYAWLVFGVLAAHILHDVSDSGAPFLWPLSIDRLPPPIYYAAQLGLCLIIALANGLPQPRV